MLQRGPVKQGRHVQLLEQSGLTLHMPPFRHVLLSQGDPGTQRHWYGGVLPGASMQIPLEGHGFVLHALGGAIVVITTK